jgi:subtilase family serine protease
MNKMNKKGKIIGLSLAVIMVVSLFAVAIPSVAAQGDPDLVITDVWIDGIRIHYKIANIGTADAPRSLTGLWINGIYRASEMDDLLEVGDELPGVFARYNYRGGEIEVCADYQNRIEEEDEENNCRGGRPDLVIIEKYETVDPDTCEFTVHFKVCNVGASDAGPSVACIHIDGNDFVDGVVGTGPNNGPGWEVPVPPLDRDTCSDELTSGPYGCIPCEILTIEVEADNYDEVEECNEENNVLENEFHCPGPDLVITDKEEIFDPVTCTYMLFFTVNNIGFCDASRLNVGPLAAGQCSDPIAFGPFGCTPCETVVVTVEADNDDDVVECDEDNNILENWFHCPGPDLVITDKEEIFDPVTCTYMLFFTVNNIGFCDAYIDGVWQENVNVGPLAAGQCSVPIELGPYECTPCEIVTIRVEADNDDEVEECDEENNILENVFHCPGPDLVITDKEEIVDPVESIYWVIFTVNNIGICDAGESTACVYIDGVHQGCDDVLVGPLAVGDCTDPIEVGPFDCPLGEDIEVKVCADNYDAVEECDEENNCMTNILPCPGVPLPDLVIMNCEPVGNRIHYTIKNIGTADAPRSLTGLWINGIYRASEMDDRLEPGDELPGVFARYNYRGGEIEVCADYPDRIEEIDEDNNCNWALPGD